MSDKPVKNRARLKEITAVLHRYEITKGLTPDKLRHILEDLGPTFIKLGQIMSMHSDVLPKEYCDELMELQGNVEPMAFSDVIDVIETDYQNSWKRTFSSIEETPLGSASIAQVHKAKLLNGQDVVIKVQKKGVYEVVSRDISLMRRANKFLPPVSIKGLVDVDGVLDELWEVTKEEMNFFQESANMEEFTRCNRDIRYIKTPKLYQEYTTMHVLVMEYIEGCDIDDKEALLANGYDLEEIGTKYADNFMKQVIDDGFFHADPHSGNVKISDGKIVWIDMGMMGRLTERERNLLKDGVEGVALRDVGKIVETVMALGEFKEPPDQRILHEGIQQYFDRYGNANIGDINISQVMVDMMDVMKKNKIIMPHGLTMLARGLSHVEGVMANICPDTNMIEIASKRITETYIRDFDWKKEAKKGGRTVIQSITKAVDIPILISDVLRSYMRGENKINMELTASNEFEQLCRRLVRNIVIGLWVTALLVSSSIICTTDMKPKILGIPGVGMVGFLIAFFIVLYVLVKHFISK